MSQKPLFDVQVSTWCTVTVEAYTADEAKKIVADAHKRHLLDSDTEVDMNVYPNYDYVGEEYVI